MRARRALYVVVGIGLLFCLVAIPAGALAGEVGANALLSGTVITVDTTLDDVMTNGNCTIREALIASHSDSTHDACPAGTGLDTIVIPAGTYLITLGGDFDVFSPTIIRGAGRDLTIIDGNQQGRVFETYVSSVIIQDLTIRNGDIDFINNEDPDEGGAGLLNHGTLTLKNVKVADNHTDTKSGGGVQNRGDLTIENSLFTGNADYGTGAAIMNMGTARISQTIFAENWAHESGGTVSNSAGATLEIDGSQLIDNTHNWDPSAIYGQGKITVRNTLIDCSGNIMEQSGAVRVEGGETLLENVTIQDCLSSDFGGAVLQNGGTVKIVRSTIKNGASRGGAGIALHAGNLEVRESLISGNRVLDSWGPAVHIAGGSGLVINSTIVENTTAINGAVYVSGGLLELRSVTLAGNTGGGLVVSGGTARVHNTILALNDFDCTGGLGGIVSLGYNLVGNASGCGWVTAHMDDLGSASQPIDPKLGPLEDNGGPTWTVELQPGSPAMDDGDNFNCPATDQRGFPRPKDGNQDGNPSCDKGAYEVQGTSVTATRTPTRTATATRTPTRTPTRTVTPTRTPTSQPDPTQVVMPPPSHYLPLLLR